MLCTDSRSTVKIPSFITNKRSETTLKEFHKFRVREQRTTQGRKY